MPKEPSTEQPVEQNGEEKVDMTQSMADKRKAQGDNFFNAWERIRSYFRESFAEWLGVSTFKTNHIHSKDCPANFIPRPQS